MNKENDFINYFYEKYDGRVALGVGYNNDFKEIFPFVFEKKGDAIGIVGLGLISNGKSFVNIFHIGAFITNRGDGAFILEELCRYADKFSIILSVSAVEMPNGTESTMGSSKLDIWYRKFGFKGDDHLMRKPDLNH